MCGGFKTFSSRHKGRTKGDKLFCFVLLYWFHPFFMEPKYSIFYFLSISIRHVIAYVLNATLRHCFIQCSCWSKEFWWSVLLLLCRSQMQTIITKACKELGIRALPSKRVSTIWDFAVYVKFHSSTENYIGFVADRNKLVCSMIDSLRHYFEIYLSGLVMWPTKLG
jgi:ABC-type transport system involved in cytochrome bd biosynthesis fused ATPase/permease subunit